MKKIGKLFLYIVLCFGMILSVSGCGNAKSKEPVTLTMWHVYGAQTDSPLNDMIDEFNSTIGQEKGIKIKVAVVSTTNDVHEAILSAAKKEPGAAELPDIFMAYPKTLVAMPDTSVLVDFDNYYTEEEKSAFVPAFVEEGTIDDKFLILPVAKSTEMLFVNKTIFDRFAADTGVTTADLETWEGLFEVSKKYSKWSDDKTPDIPNDGKAFFANDYHFNYYQVGVTAMGKNFFGDEGIAESDTLEYAFDLYADAALQGGVWLEQNYATSALRTGDIIASIASSASVLYYEDIVTYEDNTSEPIEVIALPLPHFEKGKKMTMQRGTGFCALKSTPEKEQAAITFLKWITEPQNNVRFVTQVGYMPATTEAFDYLEEAVSGLESGKYRSLYATFVKTRDEYEFYMAPKMEKYTDYETTVESISRSKLRAVRDEMLNNPEKEVSVPTLYKEFLKAIQ